MQRIIKNLQFDQLTPAARLVAKKMDDDPRVPRENPLEQSNEIVEAEEVQFAIDHLSEFPPNEQPIVLGMAIPLGVELPLELVSPQSFAPHTVINYANPRIEVDVNALLKRIGLLETIFDPIPRWDGSTARRVSSESFEYCGSEFDCRIHELPEGKDSMVSDGRFFCRAIRNGRRLIGIAEDIEGETYLVGKRDGWFRPLPKNGRFLLHHRDGKTIPFSTDRDGQFAVSIGDLRGNFRGTAYIVQLHDGAQSGDEFPGVAITL